MKKKIIKIKWKNTNPRITILTSKKSWVKDYHSLIINSLKKFKKKLDPRLYNGAILLGLDSPVIKSHGATDFIGFSNSLSVCERIVEGNLIDKIKKNIN